MEGTKAAWIERRYGVRVRAVKDLKERALVLDKRALVLVDEGLSADEWGGLISLLAVGDPRPRRGGGPPRPRGGEPRQ